MSAFSFARLERAAAQGDDPGHPRRDDAAAHRRDSDHAAVPVRLRDQLRSQASADRAAVDRGFQISAHRSPRRCAIPAITTSGCCARRPRRSAALARGDLMFVIEAPPGFDRAVDRGETPSVLDRRRRDRPDRDRQRGRRARQRGRRRSTATCRRSGRCQPQTPPFQFVVHARYNPEQLTVLNIVPGLICIVLTFSTLFVTTLAITRERERGTMENLLAMPVRPIEVMIAKIVPYVVIGYIQVALILVGLGAVLRAADPRLAAAAAWRARPVHRQQSRARRDVLDHRGQPDAGGAARAVHADAVVHAFGLHVPVPRHAAMGAMARQPVPDDPRDADRARHAAEGQRLERDRAGHLADRAVHGGRDRVRGLVPIARRWIEGMPFSRPRGRRWRGAPDEGSRAKPRLRDRPRSNARGRSEPRRVAFIASAKTSVVDIAIPRR